MEKYQNKMIKSILDNIIDERSVKATCLRENRKRAYELVARVAKRDSKNKG